MFQKTPIHLKFFFPLLSLFFSIIQYPLFYYWSCPRPSIHLPRPKRIYWRLMSNKTKKVPLMKVISLIDLTNIANINSNMAVVLPHLPTVSSVTRGHYFTMYLTSQSQWTNIKVECVHTCVHKHVAVFISVVGKMHIQC